MQISVYSITHPLHPTGVKIENPRPVCYSYIVKQKRDEGDPYETGIFIGKN